MGSPTYSLLPIDIGFDPRVHPEMRCAMDLSREDLRDGIVYETRDGHRQTLTFHDADVVGSILTQAGYRLAWQWSAGQVRLDEMRATILTDRRGGPMLQMRDPNDNARCRHQYLVRSGLMMRRALPDRGRQWRDEPAPPWWSPVDVDALQPPHLLLDWMTACGSVLTPWEHRQMFGHIVAWTPNGREVRYAKDGGVELQPPLDNWWQRCDDLAAARTWWYQQTGAK
jgi:hypothetical protein